MIADVRRRRSEPNASRWTLTLHYATYTQRARALFLDSLWWTAIVLFVPLGPSPENMPLSPEGLAAFTAMWLLLAQCAPIAMTGVLWAVWGTSPGKRALKLRIVDADTAQPMTARQAALRTFGYFLTFATCGAGFLWVLFTSRNQTLHDRIANTVVVSYGGAKGDADASTTSPDSRS
ncbi:RDD family protein (modular protein) [Burkholderia sp. 8Y]|uniref:RDD family protein n=1 Tax=Burkholderia sp. 8Y TaxID=2653133 RepID=UPI0012F34314|nr:RDD family protein [Burkholderia sp. 8Y]VXC96465.1 RDD family protein (modular protein) [Burkholderia sp. 8Y]